MQGRLNIYIKESLPLNICCWTARPHPVLPDHWHKVYLQLFPIVPWYGNLLNEPGVQLNCAVRGGQVLRQDQGLQQLTVARMEHPQHRVLTKGHPALPACPRSSHSEPRAQRLSDLPAETFREPPAFVSTLVTVHGQLRRSFCCVPCPHKQSDVLLLNQLRTDFHTGSAQQCSRPARSFQ